MISFLDSSAIVKNYVDEEHFSVVRALPGPHLVSALARVEVAAALWRKHRTGEVSLDDTAVLVEAFETDWFDPAETGWWYQAVQPVPEVVELAVTLTASHGLRGYDAMQLASAMAGRERVPECTSFAAFDINLRRAALTVGFTLIPPTL